MTREVWSALNLAESSTESIPEPDDRADVSRRFDALVGCMQLSATIVS
ncbi:MAG TPA: hypothetical protein VGA62_03055 [Acidimicrobiia bacterium]